MTKQEALREAADKIEQRKSPHNWGCFESCGCGVLAQVTTNTNIFEFKKLIHNRLRGGSWTAALYLSVDNAGFFSRVVRRIGITFPIMKTPLWKVIDSLMDTGFSTKELSNLEFQSDPSVLRRSGIIWKDATSAINTILYMRTWADMLDSQSEITAFASAEDIEFRPAKTVPNNLVPLEAK